MIEQRPRRKPNPLSAESSTRRQFLSTVVVGAAYTACGNSAMENGGLGPQVPGRSPRDRRSSPQPAPSGASAPPSDAQSSPSPGATDPIAEPTPSSPAAPQPGRKRASDQVALGLTGITVSRLAMGSGTHGSGGTSSQTKLGVAGFSRLLAQSFHEQGLNFWETADQYGAHPHLKEAISQVGREKVVVLTKTHARTAAQMQSDLDRFRRELGVDHIDVVLLHAVTSGSWTRDYAGAMEVLSRAKESGVVRAHGTSCHSLSALRLAAKSPWVDVDFARINPARIQMDADPATVIEVLQEMKAAGKGVVGMKILGVGALAKTMESAIAHAVNLDALDAFTIGFTSYKQLTEVAAKIDEAGA